MASRREQNQEDTRLRVLRLISENPGLSTRKIAKLVGISNGSTYYCINAMIHKGMIKLGNFRSSKNKRKYAYNITPNGIYEKTILTARFLQRKLEEFENLKNEIDDLEKEVKLTENNNREKI